MNIFITGIDTDSGKTVVSAILTAALKCQYWKPIQCGSPSDADTVKYLLGNGEGRILPNRYYFKTPVSPHHASSIEGVFLHSSQFDKPNNGHHIVIEGAGGILVPINQEEDMSTLALKLADKVVLVSRHYLGSINHTLLSFEAIKARGINLAGIVFNGVPNLDTEKAILSRIDVPVLFRLNHLSEVSSSSIDEIVKRVPIELLLS